MWSQFYETSHHHRRSLPPHAQWRGYCALARRRVTRPSWHSIIFLLGLAGVSHNMLISMNLMDNTLVVIAIYISLLPLAFLFGHLGNKARSSQTPRIFGAAMGCVGFMTATLRSGDPWLGSAIVVMVLFGTIGLDVVARVSGADQRPRSSVATGWQGDGGAGD